MGDEFLVLQSLSHILSQNVIPFLEIHPLIILPRQLAYRLRQWEIVIFLKWLWKMLSSSSGNFWNWSTLILFSQYLNEALAHVRTCSRLVDLLSRKKLIMQNKETLQVHEKKVQLMMLLLLNYLEENGESN